MSLLLLNKVTKLHKSASAAGFFSCFQSQLRSLGASQPIHNAYPTQGNDINVFRPIPNNGPSHLVSQGVPQTTKRLFVYMCSLSFIFTEHGPFSFLGFLSELVTGTLTAYLSLNKCISIYTKVKVPHTQDKPTQLSSFA